MKKTYSIHYKNADGNWFYSEKKFYSERKAIEHALNMSIKYPSVIKDFFVVWG